MGVADNDYISVPTSEPQQQQQQQPQQIVYGAPQSYYPQQQQFVFTVPQQSNASSSPSDSTTTTTTTTTTVEPVCCDRCDLENKVRIQRFSIVGPWLYQIIFLFYGEPFYLFSIAPLIGLFAMYTQNKWVAILHLISALFYYVFSILYLVNSNQDNIILLSILFCLIFSLSIFNYCKYIETLGELSKAGECLQSNSAIEITVEKQTQPNTTTVQPQQPQMIQPVFISAPIQQQPQMMIQPQIVYDANHNPIYHLIPIQNSNQN